METMVHQELCVMDIDAKDKEDALRQVGQYFFKNGFVKDTYIDAVVEREKVFPTGLQLEGMAIAMPHTDSCHVLKPGVTIAKLAHPITFDHMAEPGHEIQAEMIFMMAVVNPEEQIPLLVKMMELFQDKNKLLDFKNANSVEELYQAGLKNIG